MSIYCSSHKMVFEISKGAISLNGNYIFSEKSLSRFNAYFIIFSWILKVSKKAKNKIINVKNKRKQWYIKKKVSYLFVEYL